MTEEINNIDNKNWWRNFPQENQYNKIKGLINRVNGLNFEADYGNDLFSQYSNKEEFDNLKKLTIAFLQPTAEVSKFFEQLNYAFSIKENNRPLFEERESVETNESFFLFLCFLYCAYYEKKFSRHNTTEGLHNSLKDLINAFSKMNHSIPNFYLHILFKNMTEGSIAEKFGDAETKAQQSLTLTEALDKKGQDFSSKLDM